MSAALLDRTDYLDPQEESLEPSLTWADHIDAARDELLDMLRLNRDDIALERKLRLECLDRAQDAIDAARAALGVS